MITYTQTAKVECDHCPATETFVLPQDSPGPESLMVKSTKAWHVYPDRLDGGLVPIVLCGACNIAFRMWLKSRPVQA